METNLNTANRQMATAMRLAAVRLERQPKHTQGISFTDEPEFGKCYCASAAIGFELATLRNEHAAFEHGPYSYFSNYALSNNISGMMSIASFNDRNSLQDTVAMLRAKAQTFDPQ